MGVPDGGMSGCVCVCVCVVCVGGCMYVCMSGYVFRHASWYGAETWHGDTGWASEAQEHIFEVTPSKVKGHPQVKLP